MFNVVHGDKEAVDAILAHPDIKAVSFVGSTPIARYIYETGTRHGKRVQALGGAKNHAIVMPDADIAFAAEALIGAAYGSAGERCMAVSVAVAVGDAGDALRDRLAAARTPHRRRPRRSHGIRHGTGDHLRRARSHRRADRSRRRRGRDAGRRWPQPACSGHDDGFFVGPTLFDQVTPQMAIYREEIFGPVLAIVRGGVARCRDRVDQRQSLRQRRGAVHALGLMRREEFQQDVEVGMIGVNVPIPVPMAFYSFGGWRNSLFGDLHVHGMDGVRFYTRGKAVTARWPDDGSAAPGFHMPTMG